MKKIVIHKPGSYDQLRIEECPDPSPGDGDILIAVDAIGVNYADCVTRMGLYASAKHYVGYPITPGFEVAGHVIATGKNNDEFAVGDAVFAVTRFNGYATKLCVDRKQVFAIPENMSMAEAAAFPTVFLTAWFALFELVHPHAGDRVLVHSAAGGVGGALVQLGKIAGCHVTGVVGASHKVAAVASLGADDVIDKSTHSLWHEAEKISPHGFDVILDANGVATLRQSYAHLAPIGKLVVYGFHSMLPKQRGRPSWPGLAWNYLRTPRFNPFELTNRNRSVLGFNLSFLFERSDILSHAMTELLAWQENERIRAPEITAYPFEKVAAAQRDLESGQTVGKLVLET